jgi:hypothetical protein
MRILLASVVLIFLFSCQPEQQAGSTEPAEEPTPTWPDLMSEQLNYSLRTAESKTRELRLWVNYEVLDLCELHSLKDITSSSVLTHHYIWENLEVPYELDSAILSFDKPTVSAGQLINRLYELGFRELGNQPDSIATRIGDGITYYLEVRDTSYFKVIQYNSPHYFDDINDRTFMELIAELENGLNWNYIERL